MIAPYDWQLLQVFQSTLPRGERHKRPLFFVCEANFNPRSHEGSDRRYHRPERDPLFQSTLPRGERRKLYQIKCQLKYISIHAPTRGATGKRSYKKEFQHISIHAPTRGATKYSKTTKITFEISIHAPTRGATTFPSTVIPTLF